MTGERFPLDHKPFRGRSSANQLLAELFSDSPEPAVLLDNAGTIVWSNRAWRAAGPAMGAKSAGRRGTNYLSVCRRSSRAGDPFAEQAFTDLTGVLTGVADESTMDYACGTPTGTRSYRSEIHAHRALGLVSVRHFDLGLADGVEPNIRSGVAQTGISGRWSAERDALMSDGRFRALFVRSRSGLGVSDETGRYIAVNPALCRLLGRTEQELIGRSVGHFDAYHVAATDGLRAGRRPKDPMFGAPPPHTRYERPGGDTRWFHRTVHPVPGPADRKWTVTRTEDMTDYRAMLADRADTALMHAGVVSRLEALAFTDVLTSLPNRRRWDSELDVALLAAARTGRPITIALVDINDFKAFNDRNGHQAGDSMLRDFAGAALSTLRTGDIFARWGGDEFALALPRCPAARAPRALGRVRRAIIPPESCSVGWATWNFAETAEELVGRADAGLYIAKALGGSQLFPRHLGPQPTKNLPTAAA